MDNKWQLLFAAIIITIANKVIHTEAKSFVRGITIFFWNLILILLNKESKTKYYSLIKI